MVNFKEALANNATVCKVVNKTWKAAPTIAFVTGAVGSAASLYLMWRAARKHDEIVEDVTEMIEDVHAKKPPEDDEEPVEEALSLTDYRKELVKVYIKAGFKLGKIYIPAVAAEAASIGLMSLGYKELNGRYTGTLAALTLLENQYSKYRKNVVDILGEEADENFRLGLKNKEFEKPELDKNGDPKIDKNGVVKTKAYTERVLENDEMEGYSGYARIYDKEHSKKFDGDDSDLATNYYNRSFLIGQQNFFNMLLKYRPNHTVFLNEVYDALGYEPTKEGQVVGWHYDLEHPVGDNKIEFVPVEFYNEHYQAKSVILDFNVDGNVWTFL